MDRRVATSWLLGVVALVLTVPATVALARSDDGVARTQQVVGGVPVTLLEPDALGGSPGAPRPGIVVAHGFAGSAQLMDGIGLALARAGFVVALPDFAGHGANPRPLPLSGSTPAADVLDRDLSAVTAWLASRPGVARGIALVGHSMGAGAVVRRAVADARVGGDISATVAISLPDASDIPTGRPSVPRDLLLLWGAAEQPRFESAALEGLRAAYPGGDPGRTYGDLTAGTARRAVPVPGVEHIGILFSRTTLAETEQWLRAAVPAAAALPPSPPPSDDRLLWVAVLYVGATVGFVPLARLAFGSPDSPGTPVADGVPARFAAVALVVGYVAAALTAWALGGVSAALPLAVGGYLAVWFAAAGVAFLALAAASNRRRGFGTTPTGDAVPHDRHGRALLATVAMTAYAVAVLAVVGSVTWTAFALVGPRWWVLGVLTAVLLTYFWAEERLVARRRRGARAALVLLSRVLAIAVLLGGVLLLGAPGFLVLLLPLVVILFGWLSVYAFVVNGLTRARWAAAAVQAVPLAFLVATTFPLVA